MAANNRALLWPADQVERRPLASLIPNARNARTHSPEQVSQIAASMKEWGWTIPVLIDEEGGIIAGHGRVLAGHLLKYQEAPCMTARGWSDAKKRAYMIADNKLALNAGWDDEMLRLEFEELQEVGYPVELTGFDPASIEKLLTADQFDPGNAENSGDLSQVDGALMCPHCGKRIDKW